MRLAAAPTIPSYCGADADAPVPAPVGIVRALGWLEPICSTWVYPFHFLTSAPACPFDIQRTSRPDATQACRSRCAIRTRHRNLVMAPTRVRRRLVRCCTIEENAVAERVLGAFERGV